MYSDGYCCTNIKSYNDYDSLAPEDRDRLIRYHARRLWEEDGKPNGEEYRNSKYGFLKIKEIHWRMAEEKAEIYYNHNAGGDW